MSSKYEYRYTFRSNEPLGVDERQKLLSSVAKALHEEVHYTVDIATMEIKEIMPEVLEMPKDEHWQWRDKDG